MDDTNANTVTGGITNASASTDMGNVQNPFPAGGNIPEGHAHIKTYIIAVVTIAVVLSLLVFTLNLNNQHKTSGTTTSPATTTINSSPRINAVNLSLLETRGNALYGIPNSANLSVYNVTVCQDCLVTTYGLNFTKSVISSNVIVSPLQKLHVPAQYANTTTPVMLLFDAAYYNSTNTTNSTYSNVYNTLFTNSDFFNMSLKNITLSNTPASEFSFRAYGLQTYAISYRYYNYLILIMTYGNLGHLNASYVMAIANHTLGIISA